MTTDHPGWPDPPDRHQDSPVSPDDVRAAAAAYHELGPEYSEAVLAAFLARVDREISTAVAQRLRGPARHQEAPSARPHLAWPGMRRGLFTGLAIGLAVSCIPLLWFWDLGSRSPEQNAGRALVVLGWLAATAACAVSSVPRRARRRRKPEVGDG